MRRDRLHFLLLNIGHFLDHMFTLIFATVAALALSRDWGLGYGDLLKYATPGFFAFGVFAYPAGWLADRWSREGMMVVFFVGIGLMSILTGLTRTPLQLGIGLFAIGMFAAIYHPVGLAIVVAKMEEHRHAHRGERGVGQSRGRQRRADHRLSDHDIRPQAPVHILLIPKGEYVSADDFGENASEAELAAFMRAIPRIARAAGIAEDGYRILANHGRAAHQDVPHFHLHIFGGRDLGPMLRRAR